MSKSKPRLGCVTVKPNGDYEITELGLAQVRELASIGSSPAEIAQYLNVSARYMQKAVDPESDRYYPIIEDAFNEGQSEFKKRLRMAQDALMASNAQMAIHLGKHFLNQKDDVQEVNHNIRVVGTLPDYKSTPDDWKRQFAPTPLQSVEAPKPSKVIDAEVIED